MAPKRPSCEAFVPGDDVPWGEKETDMLKRALLGHRGSEDDVDWENICAIVFHGRGPVLKRCPASCRNRAVQLGLLGKGVRVEKIPWKEEEKEALAWAVAEFEGASTSIPWALIADTLFHGRGGLTRRDGKGCREQWNRSINPELDHNPLGDEEQKFVYELAGKIGNKWTRISQLLGAQFSKAPPGAERVKKGFEKYKRKIDKTEGGGDNPRGGAGSSTPSSSSLPPPTSPGLFGSPTSGAPVSESGSFSYLGLANGSLPLGNGTPRREILGGGGGGSGSPGMPTGLQGGMQTGMGTGMQTGMQNGMQTGMQTGIQTGMQTGMQTGRPTGMQTGMQAGMSTTGTQVGMQTGMSTGMSTGSLPGMSTGMQTGMSTGMQTGMQAGMQAGMQGYLSRQELLQHQQEQQEGGGVGGGGG